MTKGAEPDVARLAEELREAYADELLADPGFPGLTTRELREVWRVSHGTVNERLQTLHAAGKLEAGRKLIMSVDGIMRPSPCYRIKE
jgi:hypothetical protein